MVTCKGPSRSLPLCGHNYSQPVHPQRCPSLETVSKPCGLFTGSLERNALSSLPHADGARVSGRGRAEAGTVTLQMSRQTQACSRSPLLGRPGSGGKDSPTPLRPEHDVTVRERASV